MWPQDLGEAISFTRPYDCVYFFTGWHDCAQDVEFKYLMCLHGCNILVAGTLWRKLFSCFTWKAWLVRCKRRFMGNMGCCFAWIVSKEYHRCWRFTRRCSVNFRHYLFPFHVSRAFFLPYSEGVGELQCYDFRMCQEGFRCSSSLRTVLH